MIKHKLIFSDQRKYRTIRHVLFWLVWCVAFNLLFHFPIHVFKGWDLSGPGTRNYQELGPVLFFIKALAINSFLAVIVPQILLTYVLIYWLLPGYYYKKRNIFFTTAITALIFIVFYLTAIGFKHSSVIYNFLAGHYSQLLPYFDQSTQRVVLIDQLSSLPIILGFAIMIKLVKKWWLKQRETEQLIKEKAKAELQLLKAQVHPHFLFNTLNNIYYYTLTNSTEAPVMIHKLSSLLSYILNECNQPLVPLEKEIKMIQDYMALEKIRYADELNISIDMKCEYNGEMISPLLLLPFVENSFKHGASKIISKPWVKLTARKEGSRFTFIIKNSKLSTNEPAISNRGQSGRQGSIGLKNVKKRLELLYPKTHMLSIISERDSYAVHLDLLLLDATGQYLRGQRNKIKNENAISGIHFF